MKNKKELQRNDRVELSNHIHYELEKLSDHLTNRSECNNNIMEKVYKLLEKYDVHLTQNRSSNNRG